MPQSVGRFVVEILAGIVTYAAAIPLLLVGAICFAVLSVLYSLVFGAPPEPSHPIQDSFGTGATCDNISFLQITDQGSRCHSVHKWVFPPYRSRGTQSFQGYLTFGSFACNIYLQSPI